MIELSQLRQLLQVAESGTLSAAAKKLHVSQPALSRSIQRLEYDLGVALFHHGKNAVALNENGEFALTYARQMLNLHEMMVKEVRRFHESRVTIRLSACAPAPIWELTALCSFCLPGVTISTAIGAEDRLLLEGLLRHNADVAVLSRPVADVDPKLAADVFCTPFLREELFAVLPPHHPLAKRGELSFADLNGETFLLRQRLRF